VQCATRHIQFFRNRIPGLFQSIAQHSLTHTATHFSTSCATSPQIILTFLPAQRRYIHIFNKSWHPCTSLTVWSLAKHRLSVQLLAHFQPSNEQFLVILHFPRPIRFPDLLHFCMTHRNPVFNHKTLHCTTASKYSTTVLSSRVVSLLASGAEGPGSNHSRNAVG